MRYMQMEMFVHHSASKYINSCYSENVMQRIKNIIFLSLLIISDCAAAVTPPDSINDLLGTIRQELKQGKVVVVYRMSNDELDSEQYADWSDCLNEFALAKGERYAFHSADKRFDDFLKKGGVSVEDDYTVFMKKGGATYYYDSVILESMVYVSVDKIYSKKPLDDMDKVFLPDAINISASE
jgi:hypothetical protein